MFGVGTILATEEMEPRLFDLDFQLIADSLLTIIAVAVLFLALSYFLFNPARKFLKARQERIAGQLDDAARRLEEASALRAEYEKRLAEVDREAEEILRNARQKALENGTLITEEAREEAGRIISRAKAEAELEKKKAADDVKREMIVLATAIAGKFTAAAIDEEQQAQLVEETLRQMGEQTWRS